MSNSPKSEFPVTSLREAKTVLKNQYSINFQKIVGSTISFKFSEEYRPGCNHDFPADSQVEISAQVADINKNITGKLNKLLS